MYAQYLYKITSLWKWEEDSPNVTESLEQFPFLVLSCVSDSRGLLVCPRLYDPQRNQLGFLLQLLEPPRQVVKVDVIRGGGGVSTNGRCGECVGHRGEFWESAVVKRLGWRAGACRVKHGISFTKAPQYVQLQTNIMEFPTSSAKH